MLDLSDPQSFEELKKWSGNAIHIQHLTMKNISEKYLDNTINVMESE